LQQRNALLRQGGGAHELRPWDQELIQQGVMIARWRTDLLRLKIEPALSRHCSSLVPELGSSTLLMDPGWPGSEDQEGLSSALIARANRDRERRQTGVGPHRADWRIRFEHAPVREQLSRGQEKLVAMACALAQAEVLQQQTGEWPIFCLDDLPSELDLLHSEQVILQLRASGAQVMVTGTHFSPELAESMRGGHMFHVEHGTFRESP
jgi:DNA replication and repair protein RecF